MFSRCSKHVVLLETFLSILLILTKDCLSLKSLFIKVPEIVKSGDTVTLSCEYDLEQAALYTIKWYRNNVEFFRFVPKESPPFRAFPLSHVNVDISASGPTKVTLTDVSKEMTGDYICEVSADAPSFHTEIKRAHMVVAELPSEMPMLSIEPKKVEIGKKIKAECRSPNSFPPAKLTWYINDDEISEDTNEIKIYTIQNASEQNQELRSAKSKIEIVANHSFFTSGQMSLKCEARIHLLWTGVAHTYVRDETPLLAPVLGSTSSHSADEESAFDMFNRSGCEMASLTVVYVYVVALIHLLAAIR
ncbi:CD80-like C2-set immunoglobulin domain [Popillia japonica]|uniref:CD80-like C2-set immunoglobulin domain n=1 Tax=Popillia japonica TaxID=7064 RepID=A0AAW1LRN2_POPJA